MAFEANPAECHIRPWVLGIYKNVDKLQALNGQKSPVNRD